MGFDLHCEGLFKSVSKYNELSKKISIILIHILPMKTFLDWLGIFQTCQLKYHTKRTIDTMYQYKVFRKHKMKSVNWEERLIPNFS